MAAHSLGISLPSICHLSLNSAPTHLLYNPEPTVPFDRSLSTCSHSVPFAETLSSLSPAPVVTSTVKLPCPHPLGEAVGWTFLLRLTR